MLAVKTTGVISRCFVYQNRLVNAATVTGLFWYRREAKSNQLPCRDTPETPTSRPSKLPQELVEIIVSYFIYDIRTLLACSTTCRSWYIAAVPHLHHSLTTEIEFLSWGKSYRWSKPIQKSYELGLLPLIKRLRIRLGHQLSIQFTREWLGERTLRCFPAFTNLQELGIDNLQISTFMPDIKRYFGHFAPTLRFLALRQPNGSYRQILYFVGLFPNLQDLKICYSTPSEGGESSADSGLVPLSIPPLCGRLTLTCYGRETLVKEMIAVFGSLRFWYMDLFRVKGIPLLLDACAETLETLRLYPPYPSSENFFSKRV
jgi:hypothetical protein